MSAHEGFTDVSGLQAERTSLAWSRTLTVIAGTCGMVGVHAMAEHRSIAGVLTWAVLGGSALILAWPVSHSRLRHLQRALADRGAVTAPRALLIVAILATLLAPAAFASIVLGTRP